MGNYLDNRVRMQFRYALVGLVIALIAGLVWGIEKLIRWLF